MHIQTRIVRRKGGSHTRRNNLAAKSVPRVFQSLPVVYTSKTEPSTYKQNAFISTFQHKAFQNFSSLNNSSKIYNNSLLSSRISKPINMLQNSSLILKNTGASLCTKWLAEESSESESEAIMNVFGSLNMDMDWVYDIIPAEIIEPQPIPDWYIQFLSSEQEIERRLDDLISGADQPADAPLQHNDIPQPPITQIPTNDDFIQPPVSPESLTFESTPPTIFSPSISTVSSPESSPPPSVSSEETLSMPYLPTVVPSTANPAKLPVYHKPETNIRTFNKEFPLPKRLFNKWKDGIQIWSSKKFGKKYKDIVTEEKTLVLNELLSKDIIEKTKKGPFISDFFLLEGKEKIRPIFNYSQLTKSLNPPKFYLPSLYQMVKRINWKSNLFFVKLDFKQAFFNLNINPKSAYLTTFVYNSAYYKFKYMPFGIANAPFAAQMCLNQVTKFIKSFTPWVWGHIDDVIIAHTDPQVLNNLLKELITKLVKVKWEVNFKKSSLSPSLSLNFLGAFWNQQGVKRLPDVTQRLPGIIMITGKNLKERAIQRIRGFLIYYLSFSKYFNTIINRFIQNPSGLQSFILSLVPIDFIPYNKTFTSTTKIFSDATPTRIGAYINDYAISAPIIPSNIMIAETLAAILAILQAKEFQNIDIWVDNIATLSYLRKGTARFLNIMPIEAHFIILLARFHMDNFYNINSFYIKSSANPADKLSRL